MNCPNCHAPNIDGSRFCGQCGAVLAQAAAPTPQPQAMPPAPPQAMPPPRAPAAPAASGGSKVLLVVLGVVFALILLVVVGIYTAFHMVANKVRALAAGNEQTSSQPQDAPASGTDAAAKQGAAVTGNVLGSILGTDAKGKSDISNALNNMAQVGKQIDQHQQANGNNGAPDAQDTQQAVAAAGSLLGALGHSLGGAHRHDPVDFHVLQAMLPASLPGMQRGAPEGESDQAMGIKTSGATVVFRNPAGASVNVSIKDAAAISGLAGLAKMANMHESEQGADYERNETIGGYSVHEQWNAAARHGELSLIVGNRFGVHVAGDGVDMDTLKAALAQIDFGKLESMKDANPTSQ